MKIFGHTIIFPAWAEKLFDDYQKANNLVEWQHTLEHAPKCFCREKEHQPLCAYSNYLKTRHMEIFGTEFEVPPPKRYIDKLTLDNEIMKQLKLRSVR